MFGGNTRDVQVPDVAGSGLRRRRSRRYRTTASRRVPSRSRTRQYRPTMSSAPTRPPNSSVSAGRRHHHQRLHRSRATRGPRRRLLSYGDAVQKLKSSGFSVFQQSELAVHARAQGQGPRHQSAGQPDLGDHQRDHRHRRFGAGSQEPARRRRPDGRARSAEPHGVRFHQDHPGPRSTAPGRPAP